MNDPTASPLRDPPQATGSNERIRTAIRETFDRLVLRGTGTIVVEFMSYGCPHCRVFEPILQEVAELLKRTTTVFRVNIAGDPELAASYQIQVTPTLLVFLNGRVIGRAEGPRPAVPSAARPARAMKQPRHAAVARAAK